MNWIVTILFELISFGREVVQGVGGQAELRRGQLEQDLALDRAAALGYHRPQLQSTFLCCGW